MNKTKKIATCIYFFSILILNVEVSANHHRYNQLVSSCKAHRGADNCTRMHEIYIW